jgi:methyl-accepting chemotaxis protein
MLRSLRTEYMRAMTNLNQSADGSPPQQVEPPGRLSLTPTTVAIGLAGIVASWFGGVIGILGASLAFGGVAYLLSRHAQKGTSTALEASDAAASPPQRGNEQMAGRVGAEVMVTQVVPVWARQLNVTREATDEGLAKILSVFTEINESLQELTQNMSGLSAAPGTIDAALGRESAALDLLRSASDRAFKQRDETVSAVASHCTDIEQLQKLSKQAREIARHTRLVAFNASIESSRGHEDKQGGGQAVALEVRTLAGRMGDTSDKIDTIVNRLSNGLSKVRTESELHGITPEELQQEIDVRAREALHTLLQSIGSSVQSSSQAQQTAERLLHQLDEAFVHFQFGDRVSQMMAIVTENMHQFSRWVQAHPQATQTDAAQWLEKLEASYTMEEQRSHHHGNVHVDRGSCVDFF